MLTGLAEYYWICREKLWSTSTKHFVTPEEVACNLIKFPSVVIEWLNCILGNVGTRFAWNKMALFLVLLYWFWQYVYELSITSPAVLYYFSQPGADITHNAMPLNVITRDSLFTVLLLNVWKLLWNLLGLSEEVACNLINSAIVVTEWLTCIVGNVGNRFWKGRIYGIINLWFCCIRFDHLFLNCQ